MSPSPTSSKKNGGSAESSPPADVDRRDEDELWNPWDDSFPLAAPRTVAGGITAHSQGDAFGTTWHARRWIETLERFDLGSRVARGRRYARRGQVAELEFAPGFVTAAVQGAHRSPYRVVVAVRQLSGEEHDRVVAQIAARPLGAAQLLSGILHECVDEAFEAAGVPLLPTEMGQLSTKCSCPDWSNPCKHVAAVFFLIADELDRNGMQLLTLRGVDRELLFEQIRIATAIAVPAPATSSGHQPPTRVVRPRSEPLPSDPDAFWNVPGNLDHLVGDTAAPADAAAFARRLGAFPRWRGSEPFLDTLQGRYARASTAALDLLAPIVTQGPVGDT